VVSLHACEICVLDEADRMFDLGFIKDIRFLLRRMPVRTERQTLLFSATLSHRVLELAYEHMNEPEKLVVETDTITNAKVRQKLYFPADDEKIPLLLGLLSRSEGARTMVFVNTKAFVERVARALERGGYRVGVLSGDVPQKKRESLLGKFQKPASSRSWWPPTWPRAACTSTAYRTSTTTTCRSMPRTTCTASAAPRAWAPRATRSASPASATRWPARHRGLHRAEDPGRGDDAGTAGGAAAATARRA
jgi:hypothetical protein